MLIKHFIRLKMRSATGRFELGWLAAFFAGAGPWNKYRASGFLHESTDFETPPA